MYSGLSEAVPMLEWNELDVVQGLPVDMQKDTFINPNDRTLIAIDDLMKDATTDTEI